MTALTQPNHAIQKNKRGVISGLAVHLAGFTLGFIGEGLVQLRIIGIESGIAVLTPIGDLLYGLGLVIVVAVAARTGVSIQQILVAGTVIGIGLFYKSAPHEIHVFSGIGFDMIHSAHIGLGSILITISIAALVVMTVLSLRKNSIQN